MANTEAALTVPINVGDRFNGLTQIAILRGQFFGDDCGKDLARFISDMHDISDKHYAENKRALGAIFYLANIPATRHEVEFSELTIAEKKALISAMNHLKAVVSLFPKQLSMPS